MKPTKPIATSARILTYYVDNKLTQGLCEKYGARLEEMYKISKLTFRATLATFTVDIANCSNSKALTQQHSKQIALSALDGINSCLEEDDEEVFNAIIAACVTLPSRCIDNLIISLSEQIMDNCWSEDPASQSGPTSDPLDELLSLMDSE
jgi:hypothetical protein